MITTPMPPAPPLPPPPHHGTGVARHPQRFGWAAFQNGRWLQLDQQIECFWDETAARRAVGLPYRVTCAIGPRSGWSSRRTWRGWVGQPRRLDGIAR
jgi:hypothetical protein